MTEEERYWKERDFFTAILDQIPYFIFWKNKKSVFLGCNQRFAEIAGLNSPEEIVGKTDYDLPWKKHESDLYREDDQQVIKSKISKLNIEETQTLPDGRHIVLLTSKVPLIDKNGEAVGVLGIYNDITERKAMEMELQLAKDKAEVANKLKTEFMENMQHDMRTPAAGVFQILDILSNSKDTQEIIELIPVATKASKELLDLCNEVIDFENIEYSKHKISAKKIDIREITSRILALNSATAQHKDILLNLDVDENIPSFVMGDGYRLKKILTNLIGNGLKFTKSGEVNIAVYHEKVEKNTLFIKFDISDTGIGIPENKKEIIFEKFAKLNPSNRGSYKGTGLGLSYVKKFVDELGGEIHVKSKVGVGTSFQVTLPFGLELDNMAIMENIKTTENAQGFPFSVLLVEDDPLARYGAKKLLEKSGFHVSIAVNVAEATKLLDVQKFDLLISDIGLPDGTGFDIMTYIKQSKNPLNYLTPVVALTAHSNEEKREQTKASGFLSIFEKPLTAKMLKMIVKSVASASDLPPAPAIIDIDQTMKRLGYDEKTVFEMLKLLVNSIKEDKLLFQTAFEKNDIKTTRELFHKIKGGLNYCGVPRLQNIVNALHEEVKKISQLATLQSMYEEFYKEIDDFLSEYERLTKR